MDLSKAVENLVAQIQQYESDTFSASEYEVDKPMAEKIAAHLIYSILFDEDGLPGLAIDGAQIAFAMEMVLEKENTFHPLF